MKTATLLSLAAMASARQLTLIGEVDIDSPKVSNFFDHLVVRHSFWALLSEKHFPGSADGGTFYISHNPNHSPVSLFPPPLPFFPRSKSAPVSNPGSNFSTNSTPMHKSTPPTPRGRPTMPSSKSSTWPTTR